ncbi:MAG: class I SAM-dependent methyltransferase, partial [Planctomycetota bacterium]|nr:class I SAM-dependent methyltransferase [Planctomycetota bacterium]
MPETDSAWYRQHFNEDYRTLYAARDDAEAEVQVAFAEEHLKIRPHDRVLDLCCGHGRHLEALAKRNIRATGVDLSLPLLKEALLRGSDALLRADMRKLPFAAGAEGFSVLLNFFTSFGYFQEENDNLAVIEEIARVLRPGGRFLLDLMNPHNASSPDPSTLREEGSFEIAEERWFSQEDQRVEKRIRLLDRTTGRESEYMESVRVYLEDEIISILAEQNLKVEQVFGDFEGSAFATESPR